MSISETDRAVETLPPRYAGALTQFEDDRYDEALIVCEQILSIQPDCPEAIMLLGLISFELDEPMQALDLLTRAHDMAPDIAVYAHALSSVQARLGNTAEALFLTKLATTLSAHPSGEKLLPDRFANFFENIESASPSKFRKRAERRLEAGDLAEAEAAAEMQIQLTPGDPETLRLLAEIWRRDGQQSRVVDALHAVLHAEPVPEDRLALAVSLSEAGRHDEARLVATLAVREHPNDARTAQVHLRTLAHDPDQPASDIADARHDWCARFANVSTSAVPAKVSPPIASAKDPDAPIAVALVGNRLNEAETAHMLAPVIAGLARRKVHVHLYCDDDRETVLTDRLARHAARRTSLRLVDPETAAAIMRGDGIDIAIDMTGHGEDSRLSTFAWRPAPVCLSWCGTALPTSGPFDYLLTGPQDDFSGYGTDTEDTALWPLPATPLVYPAPPGLETPSPLPALATGRAVLGTAMHLATIGANTLALWSDVLNANPKTRLLIANLAMLDDDCVAHAYEKLSHAGLRARTDIIDFDGSSQVELEFWRHVDIAIDPQPSGSFSQTSQALWMGVPTVALCGERFSGRAGAAALKAAGREAWIAQNTSQACEIIRTLLANLNTLAELRAELPKTVAASALADSEGFADALAQAFAKMRHDALRHDRTAWS